MALSPSVSPHRPIRTLRLLRLLLFAVPGLLALGGYLYARSHAWLEIGVADVAQPGGGGLRGARLQLLDAAGKVIATAHTDARDGAVLLDYPDFGPCEQHGASPRQRWYACRVERSHWLSGVAGRLAAVSLQAGECRMQNVPLQARPDYTAALFWWLPLKRPGGWRPAVYYKAELRLDSRTCRLIGAVP